MYFILFYRAVENYVEKRKPYREEHLKYATDAHERGFLLLGGALDNPSDDAVLVFRSESPEAVEEFAKNDPYVLNGLIREWEVRPWTVVIGTL